MHVESIMHIINGLAVHFLIAYLNYEYIGRGVLRAGGGQYTGLEPSTVNLEFGVV